MDIKPYDKTIRELFLSGRQFVIPRFQREYSWEKKNYQEFFNDMINNLAIENAHISSSQYFLGTMLFIGNFAKGTEQEIQVVDGQQRLTTITILFSALSDVFLAATEKTLSEQIFKYIMTKDDNGDDVRIIRSKSHYPFFAYFIQDREKGVKPEPNTEEEICIKEAYDFILDQLNEDHLKAHLKKKHGSDIVDQLNHIDILKALRDQVLNSTFVSISTKDRNQANLIFEILNAKGKHLAHIDLIKNKIFEVLNKQEPADYAEETWSTIKDTLNSEKETVGFATFYQHFWNSRYKKTYSNKLYDDFKDIIIKTEAVYKRFMEELLADSKTYMRIINPNRSDYDNRKEYFGLVQSLNSLNNYFNVVQVRIALLALYDVKNRGIIDLSLFSSTVLFLENFHFAYNAIISGRANRLEKIYSSFAITLRKSINKEQAVAAINDKLISLLNRLYPSFGEFCAKFTNLTFSKKDNPSNVKTKYAINKLNCIHSNKELFEEDGSIEHILPEIEDEKSQNIGNLILLETPINIEAGQRNYQEKIEYYNKSRYLWIKSFVSQHTKWDETMIVERADTLAREYYTKVLGKEISEDS
jgi:uncharacterized protein with ParB-like and HNH nuclease domain